MSAEAAFRPGDVLGGKFRVVSVIGAGGMGQVFEAEDLDLQRRVALKVMQDRVGSEDGAVARFFREARAAAQLRSPHVAKVLDVGRLASGAPYLVMELLEGTNLQALLVARGPLPVKEAVDYVMEACEALAEAHRAGIVHRDLKPANLFCARNVYGQTTIKLLDFGISKTSNSVEPDPGLTDSRSMMGSPVYMSPEQLRSARNADHRSDIWSLGAVLFELVTARVVWTGQSLSEVLVQIASDPAPRLQEIEPSVPAAFAGIVARCLEKDPARRYQHIADLAGAVLPYGSERAKITFERVLRIAGDGGSATETAGRGPAPERGPSTALDSALDSRPRRSGSRATRVLALATGAAAIAVVAGVMLMVRRPTELDPGTVHSVSPVAATATPQAVQVVPIAPAPDAPAASSAAAPQKPVVALPTKAPARPAPRRKAEAPATGAPAAREAPPGPAPVDPMSLRR